MNIKLITIKRTTYNDEGVWGIFEYKYIPFALSGELPWHDNQDNVSCIPPGCYTCDVVNHKDKGLILRLLDVPDRDNVLVHIGNVPLIDSLGCILIGESFDLLNGKQAVCSSGVAMGQLRKIIGGEKQVLLKIEDHR